MKEITLSRGLLGTWTLEYLLPTEPGLAGAERLWCAIVSYQPRQWLPWRRRRALGLNLARHTGTWVTIGGITPHIPRCALRRLNAAVADEEAWERAFLEANPTGAREHSPGDAV